MDKYVSFQKNEMMFPICDKTILQIDSKINVIQNKVLTGTSFNTIKYHSSVNGLTHTCLFLSLGNKTAHTKNQLKFNFLENILAPLPPPFLSQVIVSRSVIYNVCNVYKNNNIYLIYKGREIYFFHLNKVKAISDLN